MTSRGSIRPDIAEPPLVRAGFGWFGLVEGISEWGLGVVVLSEKEILFRFWIRFAVFLLTYMAPRLALQLAHDPTMLVLCAYVWRGEES